MELYKHIIFSRFKGSHTNKQKQKIWENFARKLTVTRGIKRSGKEVRKKWQDFASLAKRKRALQRTTFNKTGGGTNDGQPRNAQYMAGFRACQQVNDRFFFVHPYFSQSLKHITSFIFIFYSFV